MVGDAKWRKRKIHWWGEKKRWWKGCSGLFSPPELDSELKFLERIQNVLLTPLSEVLRATHCNRDCGHPLCLQPRHVPPMLLVLAPKGTVAADLHILCTVPPERERQDSHKHCVCLLAKLAQSGRSLPGTC